jgi:hypothetical protein
MRQLSRSCARVSVAGVLLCLLVPCVSASPQWLNYPTPNLPRSSDGKPNLDAPAPRLPDGTPDLGGAWTGRSVAMEPADNVIRPTSRALIEQREHDFFKDRPSFKCLPSGPEPVARFRSFVQSSRAIIVLYDDLTYRIIHMDGRTLEAAPEPSWMGYSVGHWEKDTLVVESNGFNDRTWLSKTGIPHSEALRMTERYQRLTVGTIRVEVTINDPETFTQPWNGSFELRLVPDTELVEGVCESDQSHWVGTLADAAKEAVSVAPAVLARHIGVYSGPWGQSTRTLRVRLVDGVRYSNGTGGETVRLVPQSETFFLTTDGYSLEFGGDRNGNSEFVVERHVSGDWKYARQP